MSDLERVYRAIDPEGARRDDYEADLERRVAAAESKCVALECALRAWLTWDGAEAHAGPPRDRPVGTEFGISDLYQRALKESCVALTSSDLGGYYPQRRLDR